MLILDVETTGINSEKNSIVSIGALDFEHPENRFYRECEVEKGKEIDLKALEVNGYTLEQLNDTNKLHTLCYSHHLKRNISPPTKDKKTAIDSDYILKVINFHTLVNHLCIYKSANKYSNI